MRDALQWSTVAVCAAFLVTLSSPAFSPKTDPTVSASSHPANCLDSDLASFPQVGPWQDRMRSYLRSDYPRFDAVEPEAVWITKSISSTVGDIPVHSVWAIIGSTCKEAVAYFRDDGSYISSWYPDYRMVSGQKLDWKVVQLMRNDTTQDILIYLMPPGAQGADRLPSLQRFLESVADIEGVWDLEEHALALTATATPEGVAAVASLPEVESIGSNEPHPAVLSQVAMEHPERRRAGPFDVGPA